MKNKVKIGLIAAAALLTGCFFVFSHGHNAKAATTMTFAAVQNGSAAPSPQTFTISNQTVLGGSNLSYTTSVVYTPSGISWLTVSPATGTVAPQSSQTVNVTVNNTSMAVGTYQAQIQVSGTSEDGSGAINSPFQYVNVTLIISASGGTSNCSIGSFTATPQTITSGSTTLLQYSATNCWTMVLNGGEFTNRSMPSASGSISTSALTQTTTYTLTGTDTLGRQTTKSVTVTVIPQTNTCTINVASTGNSTGYAYSLSGPSSFSGSGDNSYSGKSTGTWTITYTGGALQSPISITPSSSQTCSSNSSITFTMNFPPLPPSSCTIVVNSTGNSIGYTYNISGPGSINGAGDNTYNNEPTGTWTLTYTGGAAGPPQNITPSASQSCGSGATITFHLNFQGTTNCNITSFSANPSPVFRGSATLLTWVSNGCSTMYLTSSSAFGAGTAVASSGSAWSSALNYDMPFTLDGCNSDGSSCDSKSVLVAVTNPGYFPCTLNSFSYAATGGSNYTLSWDAGGCGGVVLTGGSFGDGASFGGPIGSTSISVPRTTEYCAVGRDFTRNLYGGTRCVTITITPAPGAPSNVVANNTSTNPSIPCGQVWLSWTAGINATSYNLYRSTNSGSPGSVWQVANSTLDKDASGTVGTTYYYWVQSVNTGGTSALVISNSISPVGCQVNISTGGKNLIQVNGQNYTYSSSCISSQSGSVQTIKNGDDLKFNINICNTGTADANNVSVKDDLTGENLVWHGSAPVFVGGTSTSYSVSGNVIIFNFGTIAMGTKGTVTFDLDANAPTGNTQSLLRLRNVADITYTSSAPAGATGCIGSSATTTTPCVYDTGYIVFYNGVKAPTIKEINP